MVEISLTNQADFVRRNPLVFLPASALSNRLPSSRRASPPVVVPVAARSSFSRRQAARSLLRVSRPVVQTARKWPSCGRRQRQLVTTPTFANGQRVRAAAEKTVAAGCMPPAAEFREAYGSPDGKANRSLRVVRTRRLPRPHVPKGKRGFKTLRSRTLCSERLAARENMDGLLHTQEKNPLFVIIFSRSEHWRPRLVYGCIHGWYSCSGCRSVE